MGLVLLAGCPQVLDDDFRALELEPPAGTGAMGNAGVGGSSALGAGAGGAGTTDARPLVVAVSPTDGARGVLPDAEIVFTFSAAMDTRSVEAAYTSDQLPAAQVSFVWSDGDTVLRVLPAAELEVASGSDPASVVAHQYAIDISARARDKAGNTLAPAHLGFSVVRSLTQTLGAVQNRDLTGNWRTDGSYGVAACERIDTTICMGDSISAGEPAYRGFVTFDTSTTPREPSTLLAAELSGTVVVTLGEPFDDLGALQLEHVAFGSIGDEAFSAPALSEPKSISLAAALGERIGGDVLAEVQSDWSTRDQTQFRLSFEIGTNADGAADMIQFDWSSVQLALTYWAP